MIEAKEDYLYNAIVTKVYDGDTITCDIDLGLGVWVRNEKIRLYGINAPEVRGDTRMAGLESRDCLRFMVLDKKVILNTIKDKKGKYGRYLGDVYVNGVHVNEAMVIYGHAIRKEY